MRASLLMGSYCNLTWPKEKESWGLWQGTNPSAFMTLPPSKVPPPNIITSGIKLHHINLVGGEGGQTFRPLQYFHTCQVVQLWIAPWERKIIVASLHIITNRGLGEIKKKKKKPTKCVELSGATKSLSCLYKWQRARTLVTLSLISPSTGRFWGLQGGYLLSLNLNFLAYKMEVILSATEDSCWWLNEITDERIST